MNIYETFNNLRYHYENEVVEFKKAENSFSFDELGKYFSALSNEANLRDKDFAWLVFGVHDKTREILGTSYKNGMKSLQKLKYDLSQHTTDRNTFRDIYELEVEGKRVLMFQIPAAPRGIPMAWQGHFYARRGESLVALDMSKYEEIRRQTVNEDWTAEVVADATIDDLDKEAIAKAREGYKQRYPTLAKECDRWEDKVFLDKAGLTIDGNYSLMLLTNQDMSLMDAVLLDQVQKGKPISDNAIKKLRKEGLIEGRKPHLYVSKQVAKATNTQVEYTLKKGFNDAECQEWIMKALNDHKVLSRKQINELLWNKLPIDYTDDQRVRKIGNLLTKLRKNGVIYTDENRLWHLNENLSDFK